MSAGARTGGNACPKRRLCALVICGMVLSLGTTARADVARILADDWEAAQARVDLIQQAQAEIEMTYYIFDFDNISLMMMAVLRDAAWRGVNVRLIVDASRNKIPDAMQAHLIACGVQIREYHPCRCAHPCWINRRMHDKTLIVDRQRVIAGSRNISDPHFGLSRRNYIDRDVYLAGQVGVAAHQYFMCLWTSKHVFPTRLKDFSASCPEAVCEPWLTPPGDCRACCPKDRDCGIGWAADYLDRARAILDAGDVVRLDAATDWSADLADLGPIPFVYDPAGQKCCTVGTDEAMCALIDSARCVVVLETPYFVASAQLKRALAQARRRGVRVQVLTNSLSSTDQVLAYAAYTNEKRLLVAHGIELYEFQSCHTLHAKSALIDGCTSVIGSYNFDPRSQNLNTEVAAIIRDPAFAEQLRTSIDEHLALAVPVGGQGRPIAAPVCRPCAEAGKLHELRCKRLMALLLKRYT